MPKLAIGIIMHLMVSSIILPAAPVRFALVSDTHISASSGAAQTAYRQRLLRSLNDVNHAKVDGTLIAGDLTENGTGEQFTEFKKIIRGFKAPIICVPGNHDVGSKPMPNSTSVITEESLQRYEREMGKSFGARTIHGVLIVYVNASLLGSGLKEDADQRKLLEHELRRDAKQTKILLLHYPPYLASRDEVEDPYWNLAPAQRNYLLNLAEKGGVSAVFSGHLHRILQLAQGNLVLYTTPPVSFGLPQGKQPEGWTLVSIERDGTVKLEFKSLTTGISH